MSTRTRTPFTLADLARVVTRPGSAQLVLTHPKWCAAAETGRPEDCQCGDAEWRIVEPQQKRVRR
jgi:hypothetical protein